MGKTGRNQPCPCGSGKKYKRCCMGKEEEGAATEVSAVDGTVTKAVLEWVGTEHPERMAHVRPLLDESLWENEDAVPLLVPLLAWETPSESGEPLSLDYPARLQRSFDPRQQDWFEEQNASWFSLWDVLEVRRDEGMFLRDLFTREERFVRERMATHTVSERSVLLARTARLGDVWVLEAIHPGTLPPMAAEQVAATARRTFKLGRGKVDPTRLRGKVAFQLADLWNDAVAELSRAPRPRLCNTEGDELLLTNDMFVLAPGDRPEILERLRGMPDLEPADEDPEVAEEEEYHVFDLLREIDDVEQRVCLARIALSDLALEIDTNSTRRADETRDLLEERLSGLIVHLDREEMLPGEYQDEDRPIEGYSALDYDLDVFDEDEDGDEAGVHLELTPEEEARLILAYKEKHYASWPDIPLPALGGRTPREAAGDKRRKVYRDLDLVLREIERSESMLPFEKRYDVGILRRELGLQ